MNSHRPDGSSSIPKSSVGLSFEKQRDEIFSKVFVEMNAVLDEPEIKGANGAARSRTAIYQSPYLEEGRRVSAWIIRSYQEGPAYLMTQSLSADMAPDEPPITHIGFSKEGKLYADKYSNLSAEQMIKVGQNVLKTIDLIKNTDESLVTNFQPEETATIASDLEPDISTDDAQENQGAQIATELPKVISVPVRSVNKPRPKAPVEIKKPAKSIPTRSQIKTEINDKDVSADDSKLGERPPARIIEKSSSDVLTSDTTSLSRSSERKLASPFERGLRRFLDGLSDDMPLISNRIEALRAERMVQDGAFAGDTYLREEVREEIKKFYANPAS